jgi:hypothetical protein
MLESLDEDIKVRKSYNDIIAVIASEWPLNYFYSTTYKSIVTSQSVMAASYPPLKKKFSSISNVFENNRFKEFWSCELFNSDLYILNFLKS